MILLLLFQLPRLQGKNFCIVYYHMYIWLFRSKLLSERDLQFSPLDQDAFKLANYWISFLHWAAFYGGEFNAGTHFPNCACHDIWILWHYDISIIIIFQRIKRTKKYIGCLLLLLLGENRPFSVKSWPDVLQQLLMHDTHKMRTHFFVQENPTFCFWEGGSRPLIIVKLCLHQLLFYFSSKRSVFKPISFASKNGILSKGTWFFMW